MARKEEINKMAKQNPFDTVGQMVEHIFPELAESEDERIRKEIVAIFKGKIPYTSEEDAKRYIAWLEKQQPLDKEELAEEALKYIARQFMNWLDAGTPEDKMCLSNMECEDIEDAFLKDDWARITHYIKKKLEKQEDTNETSDEWGEEDKQIIWSIEQVMNCASLLNIVPEKIDNIKSWFKSLKPQKKQRNPTEKQGQKLDATEVIEWINNQACCGYIEDIEVEKFVEQFKKDFGI